MLVEEKKKKKKSSKPGCMEDHGNAQQEKHLKQKTIRSWPKLQNCRS
jgi:hypothetical protein